MILWYMTPCSVLCGYELHVESHCPYLHLYTEKAGSIFLRRISMIIECHNPKGNNPSIWQLRLKIPFTHQFNVTYERFTFSLDQTATYSGKAGAIFILKTCRGNITLSARYRRIPATITVIDQGEQIWPWKCGELLSFEINLLRICPGLVISMTVSLQASLRLGRRLLGV